jgi:two-component system chemotaxis response regulator CheY
MKILLVDDSVTVRYAEKKILAGLGLNDVVEATDGAMGLKIAFQEKPELILMDWEMPTLSGIEALRLLKANPLTQATPVIMVTGSNDKKKIMEAIKLGAADYVIKPFTPETIQKKLSQFIPKPVSASPAPAASAAPAAPASDALAADAPVPEAPAIKGP